MHINKKIQAFTLAEMIVVIILTSIVVGLAFSVLTLVQKQMLGIQKNYAGHTELNLLEQSLYLDFNRYSEINYNDSNSLLSFTSAIDTTTYKFKKDIVIKGVDTFQVKIEAKTFYFAGDITSKGNLDAIKLESSKDYMNQKLFIYKRNDATLYMK